MNKEEKDEFSYATHLFDKNELLDRKLGEYSNAILNLKSITSKVAAATDKFVKGTKIKEITKKKPLSQFFNEGAEFSQRETQRAAEFTKRSNRHATDVDRLKRYVENNRKVLRRRTRKNEKLYNQNKKILETIKRKQNKHAREAHDWFIKHDGLSNVKGHDKQELEFIEFRFIHAAQEEAKFSQEYETIAKKLKTYQTEYTEENTEILKRYEEFDSVAQNRVKEQFLCFIEEMKRNLTSRLRSLETWEQRLLDFDIGKQIKMFIKENHDSEYELEKPHQYEPFVPIYKRSILQQESILKQPAGKKKILIPKRKPLPQKSPRKETPSTSERIHRRTKSTSRNDEIPAHPSKKSLPETPKVMKKTSFPTPKTPKKNPESEDDYVNRESRETNIVIEKKPKVKGPDPIRTPEVIWFESFYLKLTEHDEVVSTVSSQDFEEDELSERVQSGSESLGEIPKSANEKDSQGGGEGTNPVANIVSLSDLEEDFSSPKERDSNWEFGVSRETMKKAFDMLDSAIGRQGFALALNYQRHHPYIVSQTVYEKIGELFTKCLYKSMEYEDQDVGKMLLNMCQTFYTIRKKTNNPGSSSSSKKVEEEKEDGESSDEDEETVFYYQHLKNLSIWRDIRFWRGCFYDTMSQMRMKTVHFSQKWRDLDETKKEEAQREHANMTFGVLTSFVFQMMQAGMGEDEVKRFIQKMCEINSLKKEQVSMIMLNFEEMIRAKMIPEL